MYFIIFIQSSQVLYELNMPIFTSGETKVQRNSIIHSSNTDRAPPVPDTILVTE